MRSVVQYSVIDAHSAGAPARVVIGGVAPVRGNSIREKREVLLTEHDHVRKLLMYEPRGSSEMCGSILMAPCEPDADFGIVFIESGGWPIMCGAGTIGAATVVVETGMVPMVEPVTLVRFDTPAGRVDAEVAVEKGVVKGVTIRNVISYLVEAERRIEVPGYGEIAVDLSYGGNYYALVRAGDLGLEVAPPFSEDLVRAGRAVRAAVNAQPELVDPVTGQSFTVPMVILCEDRNSGGTYRNLVFFGGAGVDRSPGGTGTSARMAALHARGLLSPGETFPHESIIGSVFHGHFDAEPSIAGVAAIRPYIRGRAHVISHGTYVLDPEDPFTEGFGVGYGSDAKTPSSA